MCVYQPIEALPWCPHVGQVQASKGERGEGASLTKSTATISPPALITYFKKMVCYHKQNALCFQKQVTATYADPHPCSHFVCCPAAMLHALQDSHLPWGDYMHNIFWAFGSIWSIYWHQDTMEITCTNKYLLRVKQHYSRLLPAATGPKKWLWTTFVWFPGHMWCGSILIHGIACW